MISCTHAGSLTYNVAKGFWGHSFKKIFGPLKKWVPYKNTPKSGTRVPGGL